MIAPKYRAQVDLLLQILPYVAKEKTFALKGGTTINCLWLCYRLELDVGNVLS